MRVVSWLISLFQEFARSLEEASERQQLEMKMVRDAIAAGEEALKGTAESLRELQASYRDHHDYVNQQITNINAVVQDNSAKLEVESNKRRQLHSMLDEM
jgi:chromosome condensin MukBEF complex kleisin-like MukF subunit